LSLPVLRLRRVVAQERARAAAVVLEERAAPAVAEVVR
jgi:hypothetical protein